MRQILSLLLLIASVSAYAATSAEQPKSLFSPNTRDTPEPWVKFECSLQKVESYIDGGFFGEEPKSDYPEKTNIHVRFIRKQLIFTESLFLGIHFDKNEITASLPVSIEIEPSKVEALYEKTKGWLSKSEDGLAPTFKSMKWDVKDKQLVDNQSGSSEVERTAVIEFIGNTNGESFNSHETQLIYTRTHPPENRVFKQKLIAYYECE